MVLYSLFQSEDDSSETNSVCSEGREEGGEGGRGRVTTAGAKKGRPMIVSDDSEGSSLDSSDNEFEEQIRKMKVSRSNISWNYRKVTAGLSRLFLK